MTLHRIPTPNLSLLTAIFWLWSGGLMVLSYAAVKGGGSFVSLFYRQVQISFCDCCRYVNIVWTLSKTTVTVVLYKIISTPFDTSFKGVLFSS